MSPEQCREEEYDERADIYSLGATYHTLLTGLTPYVDASLLQIMFAHCSAPVPAPPPPPPSAIKQNSPLPPPVASTPRPTAPPPAPQ